MELVSNDLFFNAPDLTQDTQQNQGLSKIGQIKQRMANFNMQNQGAISQSAPSLNANQNTAQDEAYIQNLYQHAQEIAKQPLSAQEMQEAQKWKPEHMQSDPKQQRQVMRQGVFDEITGALKPVGDALSKYYTIAVNQIDPVAKFDNNVLNLFRDEDEKKQVQNKAAITHETERIYGKMLEDMTHTDTPEQRQALENFVFNLGDKQGYDVFVDTIKGKERFIFKDRKTGKEMDVTPNMWDNFKANSSQITGEVLGALMPGGLAARMVKSGLGGAALGQADLNQQEAYTGQDLSLQDRLKKSAYMFGEGAAGELVGEAALRTLYAPFKAYQSAKQGIQKAGQMGQEALNGGANLKETIFDKAQNLSPDIVTDLSTQGVKSAELQAKKDILETGANYDEALQTAREVPLEVNQGNAFVNFLNDKLKDMGLARQSGKVKDIADKLSLFVENVSKNASSKASAQAMQDLVNLSLTNPTLAKDLNEALMKSPTLAVKFFNTLAKRDEALMKNLNLDEAVEADELYKLAKSRQERAGAEFEAGLKELEALNPNGIYLAKDTFDEALASKLPSTKATPSFIKKFIDEVQKMGDDIANYELKELAGELNQIYGKNASVKEVQQMISNINKKLAMKSNDYAYKEFLGKVKDELAQSLIKNAKDKNTAKAVYDKMMKDYADFSDFKNSAFGRVADDVNKQGIKGSEEQITKKLKQMLDETNENFNYEAITKSLSDEEVAVFDKQILKRFLEKNQVEAFGKKVTDYEALMQDLKNYKPKSNNAKLQMEVLQAAYKLQPELKKVVENIASAKNAKLSPGLSPNAFNRGLMMVVNTLSDYIAFYLTRIVGLHKEAAKRIQLRRALSNLNKMQDFNKATSDFINSIKDKSIKEQALKAKAEFEKKTKDLLKGDGFFMNKPDLKPAKSDLKVKISLDDWVKELAGINPEKEIIADLAELYNKHKEFFTKESEVFKLIQAIKANPTFFYKNNKPDKALIGAMLENGKLGKMAIQKDYPNSDYVKVKHATMSSKKNEHEKLLNKGKSPLVETANSTPPTLLEKGRVMTANGAKALSKGDKNLSVEAPHSTLPIKQEQMAGANAHSINPKDTLPEKSLNLLEALKQKREKEQSVFENFKEQVNKLGKDKPQKDLKQQFNELVSANQAERKLKDDRIKDFKDRMINLNTNIDENTAQAWMKEFNLKSLDDDFVPEFKNEIRQALKTENIDKIKLSKGSLVKLVKENRIKYLNRIKPTLQEPDRIIKQNDGALIFARDFGDIKYFTSVARNSEGEWIVRSNAPKSKNGLENKIKNGGVEIYKKASSGRSD